MKDYGKIAELIKRIQAYEKDEKPLYLSIYYTNKHNPKGEDPTPFATRIKGESEFQAKISEILTNLSPFKIFVREFPNKSTNTKEEQFKRETIIEVKKENEDDSITVHHLPATQNHSENSTYKDPFESYGGLAGFEQKLRGDIAKEYQLAKEQDEKKKLIEDNVLLKKENEELKEDNTKLYEINEELTEQVQDLQKYIPENIKIGDVSLTKVLGSILGTAAETVVKNVVTKKPDKVRDILGDTAFEQLAGLLEDEPEETYEELDENHEQHPVQELQSVPVSSEQEDRHMLVANAIHELNKRVSSSDLGKIQLIYYFFLNDDETINQEKLNTIVKIVNEQKEPEDDTE